LKDRYSQAICEHEKEIDRMCRQCIRETLIHLFPGVDTKEFDEQELYSRGLPREEPDRSEYF
jgi:hypothetical protein